MRRILVRRERDRQCCRHGADAIDGVLYWRRVVLVPMPARTLSMRAAAARACPLVPVLRRRTRMLLPAARPGCRRRRRV
jgi:hypothetical protein